MGLQELFDKTYGEGGEEATKEAAEVQKVEKALEKFTDEEVVRLQAAGGLLDAYGYEFEDGETKLAAAAELLDAIEVDEGGETAAAPADGAEAAADGEPQVFEDEEGNVFQFLGKKDDLAAAKEDEKTAQDAEAQGRFMAVGFHAELAKLQA